MATKKSTPGKTNAKVKTNSAVRNAAKGFAAGLNSTLGPDPKPYNRAKTSGTKTSAPRASNASTARGQRLNSSASMPKGNLRTEGERNVIPSTHAANWSPLSDEGRRALETNYKKQNGIATNWSPLSEEGRRALERHAKSQISAEERASNPRMYNNAGRKNDRAKNRK